MLVLSRKRSESIVIGEAETATCVLKITVIEIRGKVVKLGFEADGAVRICRSEVWERIRAHDPAGPWRACGDRARRVSQGSVR